jgi:para-aminobenzoate synthetase component 1
VKSTQSFVITDYIEFKQKMLNWAKPFNIFCLLDNQQYKSFAPSGDGGAFESLLAVGSKANIEVNAGTAFTQLKDFYDKHTGWLFGHLGYDLKNETEKLSSANFDGVGFSDLHFFVPEIVLQLTTDKLIIFCDTDAAEIFDDIQSCSAQITATVKNAPAIQNRISRENYLATIKKIQQQILRGDCYELNFCQEFYAQPAAIDPVAVYHQLTELSPNPFAALYKLNNTYCLCASPERYLKKTGDLIISQPIKGTAKRDLANKLRDEQSKTSLLNSNKERSENVMVVDLVRNDLSKICQEGSVKVDELFGIYSFPQVHQMISTVSGRLQNDIHWVDAIKATFPMGSMTGAPKKRVMELIEDHEQTKRGLFSGAIGYINPAGDFDFNVVIRSVLYNSSTQYLSFQTGGAITFYSDAEQEYEESLLKSEAIKAVLR